MRWIFYIVVLGGSIGVALYPWLKNVSRIECNAKLHASLTCLTGVLWSLCGILIYFVPHQSFPSFLGPEKLDGIKTFIGGAACGLAVIFLLLRVQGNPQKE